MYKFLLKFLAQGYVQIDRQTNFKLLHGNSTYNSITEKKRPFQQQQQKIIEIRVLIQK